MHIPNIYLGLGFEIGGCSLSIFRLFHAKDIGIDFRLVNCLLTGQRNLEIRLFMTFIQLLLCSFTEVLTKFKEPAS